MKKISIITIAIVILLAGCSLHESNPDTTSHDYSFENPDIIAYVDGEPVNKVSMDNNTIIKKAYMEAITKYIEECSNGDDLFLNDKLMIEIYMEQIKEIKSYSCEKDWTKDYYKSIFMDKKFHDIFKNADEQLNTDADEEVKYVLDRANSDSDIESDSGIIVEVDNGIIDVVPVIQSVANGLGISFEECVNNVYRPFWITEDEYEILLNIKYDGLDYGEKVEYNGANESEYIDYVSNAMEIDRNYLNSLFEKAEIVERP